MKSFLASEKVRYEASKPTAEYLSPGAREKSGFYSKAFYPFCLPEEYAEENLFEGIRQSAQEFFHAHEIKWHGGLNRKPSNHLCSSQICCVNFLFPFSNHPQALAELLRSIYPELDVMEVIEGGQYVSFEWIGRENYLGEKISRNGKRPRGALFTSADAAVMFRTKSGKRQIVLIEWKYTESYHSTPLHTAKKSQTDRVAIYQHLYDMDDGPLDKTKLSDFKLLFYEPFYQFMRQQFLAYKMEVAHELGADLVSVLHIAPAHNKQFQLVTSHQLLNNGATAVDIWKSLVCPADRFHSISTEALFGSLTAENMPSMEKWLKYIHTRYPWVQQQI